MGTLLEKETCDEITDAIRDVLKRRLGFKTFVTFIRVDTGTVVLTNGRSGSADKELISRIPRTISDMLDSWFAHDEFVTIGSKDHFLGGRGLYKSTQKRPRCLKTRPAG